MTSTEQDKELRDILSKVLLDGQNQIHDLKDGKATPEQITERMFASLDYWQPKLMQLITADRKRVALEARMSELEVQLHYLRWMLTHYKPHTKNGLAHAERLLEERIEACKKELEKL